MISPLMLSRARLPCRRKYSPTPRFGDQKANLPNIPPSPEEWLYFLRPRWVHVHVHRHTDTQTHRHTDTDTLCSLFDLFPVVVCFCLCLAVCYTMAKSRKAHPRNWEYRVNAFRLPFARGDFPRSSYCANSHCVNWTRGHLFGRIEHERTTLQGTRDALKKKAGHRGTSWGPLFRARLIISLHVLICPHLATCWYKLYIYI